MIIAVFLLISSMRIQAQTTQAKLNQVELMKQFLGAWKTDFTNGDAQILDFAPYGPAMINTYKNIHADTIIYKGMSLWGYDKTKDKIINAQIDYSSPDITIGTFSFTSKNIIESKNVFSPDSGDSLGTRFEFKTADLFFITTINNNKDVATHKFTRVKK